MTRINQICKKKNIVIQTSSWHSRHFKKTNYDAKIATNSAIILVRNKVPDVGNLVEKTDYKAKISEIEKKVTDHNHDKYITTPEFKKFTAEIFAAKSA